jgi:hypothetical protein
MWTKVQLVHTMAAFSFVLPSFKILATPEHLITLQPLPTPCWERSVTLSLFDLQEPVHMNYFFRNEVKHPVGWCLCWLQLGLTVCTQRLSYDSLAGSATLGQEEEIILMFLLLNLHPHLPSLSDLFLNFAWVQSLIGALFCALGKSFGSAEVSSHLIYSGLPSVVPSGKASTKIHLYIGLSFHWVLCLQERLGSCSQGHLMS